MGAPLVLGVAERVADELGGEPLLISERIRNALTDEITGGELPPGTALDEQQLATRFGASRTPVREALRQLAVSGLVDIRPRRGVVVAHMTPERVMEMFETVAEIEALCVRLATYRMTPAERGRLLELHDEASRAAEAGDVDAYDGINAVFHEALYTATHNAFLAEQAISLRGRLNAFRRTQLRHKGRLARSIAEHGAILAAIAEGDGETASRRMRAHMSNAAIALQRYLEQQS